MICRRRLSSAAGFVVDDPSESTHTRCGLVNNFISTHVCVRRSHHLRTPLAEVARILGARVRLQPVY